MTRDELRRTHPVSDESVSDFDVEGVVDTPNKSERGYVRNCTPIPTQPQTKKTLRNLKPSFLTIVRFYVVAHVAVEFLRGGRYLFLSLFLLFDYFFSGSGRRSRRGGGHRRNRGDGR